MATFLSLQQRVYRACGFADSPATEVATRTKMHLNEIHRRLMGLPGMDYLRQSQITFDSVASTPQYALPPDVQRILTLRDASNQITLQGQPYHWYLANETDPTATTGTPEVWCPVGIVACATQPANASKVYADSTSGSDTGTVYIEGVRTGGYPFSASATMTGQTAVQVSAYADIIAITKFYLSTAAVGTVTLHEDAEGGTELSRIPIGQTHARYLRIALWPTPAAVVTYTVDYQRHIADMANDYDEPLLPEDFHWLVATGARMLEYERQDDRRYPAAQAEFAKGVRDLKWYVTQQVGGDAPTQPPSRLGPWYPAGS